MRLTSKSHPSTDSLSDTIGFSFFPEENVSRLLTGVSDTNVGSPSGWTNGNTPPSSAEPPQQPLQQQQSSSKFLTKSSNGMIAWYCFIVSLVVPIFVCVFYRWIIKCRSQRRAQQALDSELRLESDIIRLSQMQANIQAFSVGEKHRRTKIMRAAVRRNIVVSLKGEFKFALCCGRGRQTFAYMILIFRSPSV